MKELNKEMFILSDYENNLKYEDIKFKYFTNDDLSNNKFKTAYYLGGQPGSGKTTVRNQILKNSENPQNIIILNTDELREYHPEYSNLMSNPNTVNIASQLVNHDASIWFTKLKNEAFEKGYDILFDSTLGTDNVQSFENGIKELKDAGYKTELHVLAVPKEISKLGIHLRYESQVNDKGFGRFVNMQSHNINYKNLPNNVEKLINEKLFDSVSVHRKKIYLNEDGVIKNNAFDLIHNSKNPNSKEVLSFIEKGRHPIFNEIEVQYLIERIQLTETFISRRGGDDLAFKTDTGDLRNVLELNNLSELDIKIIEAIKTKNYDELASLNLDDNYKPSQNVLNEINKIDSFEEKSIFSSLVNHSYTDQLNKEANDIIKSNSTNKTNDQSNDFNQSFER